METKETVKRSEDIKQSVLSEKWHVHTATGYSVRSESGEIVFKYGFIFHTFNDEHFERWLDYANHICELHNKFIEGR